MGFAGSAAKSPWEIAPPASSGSSMPFAAFSIITDGTLTLMYVPANCVKVNNKAFSPSGLTPDGTLTGWYDVSSFTNGLNLYIAFSESDSQAGKPVSAEFAETTPYTANYIEIPILTYADNSFSAIALGGINYEKTGVDSQGCSSTMASLAKPGGDGWTDEDHTIELHGFRNNTALAGTLLCTGDSYTHSFAVREHDGTCAELRWVSDSALAKAVGQYLVCTCEWVCDGGSGAGFCLTTEFWCWYDALGDCGYFWEKGGGIDTNYGSAIGSDACTTAINLASHILSGSWTVECTLEASYLCSGSFSTSCANISCLSVTDIMFGGTVLSFCNIGGVNYLIG